MRFFLLGSLKVKNLKFLQNFQQVQCKLVTFTTPSVPADYARLESVGDAHLVFHRLHLPADRTGLNSVEDAHLAFKLENALKLL